MKRLLIVTISAALSLVACGGNGADPGGVIDDYIAAYNAGDIDGVTALFSEESVVTGHPMRGRMEGLAAIRATQVDDMSVAATQNAYTISNVEVTGDTVTWDSVWISIDGEQFCKQGHAAVIKEGKIITWVWPGGGFDCP